MSLSTEEIRVLGCLLEKEHSTPDAYPLTLHALVGACNQTTNRSPVVSYDEFTVERALASLREQGLARRGVYAGSRTPKHRHALDETWHLSTAEQALLCLLMLRGPQTLGELKSRSERLYQFSSLEEIDETLNELAGRADPLVKRIPRQPGQKEGRVTHTLAEGDESGSHDSPQPADDSTDRISLLEIEVRALRAELDELRTQLGELADR